MNPSNRVLIIVLALAALLAPGLSPAPANPETDGGPADGLSPAGGTAYAQLE